MKGGVMGMTRSRQLLALELYDAGVFQIGSSLRLNPDALADALASRRLANDLGREMRALIGTTPILYDYVLAVSNTLVARAFLNTPPAVYGTPLLRAVNDKGQWAIQRDLGGGSLGVDHGILLIDDATAEPGQRYGMFAAIKARRLIVRDILLLTDCSAYATKELEAGGFKVWILFTVHDLLETYLREGRINEVLYERILTQMTCTT